MQIGKTTELSRRERYAYFSFGKLLKMKETSAFVTTDFLIF